MRLTLLTTIWTCVFAALATTTGFTGERNADYGKELFARHWSIQDDQCRLGDGLGPMFNAHSCADCHHQGALGGGGDLNSNVDILTVDTFSLRDAVRINPIIGERIRKDLIALHPGFEVANAAVVPSIVLHSHSSNRAYSQLRSNLLSRAIANDAADRRDLLGNLEEMLDDKPIDTNIRFRLTRRNTPAVFGSGLIDRIPGDLLDTTVARLSREYPQVSGRIPRVGARRLPGRFGWRSQTSSLDEFVRGACANELGLQVRDNPQPINPNNPESQPSLVDLNEQQCDALVDYVGSLPQPRETIPNRRRPAELATHGKQVFTTAGCAACHVEDLGPAQGIYSDLALHDMGRGLEDPWPAPAPTSSSVPGYYGSQNQLFTSLASLGSRQQEWRTPPLWGVADSAPYLHDGRAPTLTAAIVAHGGEALFSTEHFLALPPADRTALLAYLSTLRAPMATSTEEDAAPKLVARTRR